MRNSSSGKKTAVLYTRVSTEEQANHGYSLRSQERRLRAHCQRENIHIAKHIAEDASAKTFDRKGFNELLSFVKQNRRTVDLLLFVKWDRFSRNLTESFAMMSKLESLGVEANAIDQLIDHSVPENKIMLAVFLASPEVENERRSLAVIRGMRQAKREGRFVAKPPKGYSMFRRGGEKPSLVLNQDAPLVRKAYQMAAKGMYQLEEIRNYLRRHGMQISRNQMSKMLRNPVYGGKIHLQEYRDEPEELVDAIHEPIIPWTEFQRVQERLRELKSKRRGKPTRTHASIPLRGHLQCRRCSGNLTGGRSRGNGGDYWYYHCRNGCKERIGAAKLDKAFDALLQQIQIPKKICDLYKMAIEDVFKENEHDRSAQVTRLQDNLVCMDERLIKIDDLFVDEKLSDEAYQTTRQRYTQQRASIEGRIDTLASVDSQFTEYMRFGFSLLTNLPDYYREANLETKRKIAGSIFPGKLIFEDDMCRTTEVNPAITLFSPNLAQNDRNGKGHDNLETVMPLKACSMDVYNSALGEVQIDDLVRNELCDEDDDIFLDDRGHFSGTGMDTQLPFLQKTLNDFSVVPLVMGAETVDFCKELGSAIGEIMSNRNTLVLACVDVVEASEKGMDLFRSHLMNLDITAMMVLLNQESEIKVQGKGPVLVAMIAATQRRADVVKITEMNSALNGRQGFAGALIGRY